MAAIAKISVVEPTWQAERSLSDHGFAGERRGSPREISADDS